MVEIWNALAQLRGPDGTAPSGTLAVSLEQTTDPNLLRPPCRSSERLLQWRPIDSPRLNLIRADNQNIHALLIQGYAENTRDTYGAGLKLFHAFCNARGVSETDRAPASRELVTEFVGSIIGFYAQSTIKNYYYAILAWHRIHLLPISTKDDEIELLFKTAAKVSPPQSKRTKREPLRTETIQKIHAVIDPTIPIDVAVYACLTTSFYAIARLGEFTTKRMDDKFDPAKHISLNGLALESDNSNNQVHTLHIPSTKASPTTGEKVQWAKQNDTTDPVSALEKHIALNKPGPNEHLFAFTANGLRHPLSKRKFQEHLATLATKANVKSKFGHNIRIGGTLEYLLRKIPFEVVKVIGRWSSDAFHIYLRKHGQILAQYLQDSPIFPQILHAIPPVR